MIPGIMASQRFNPPAGLGYVGGYNTTLAGSLNPMNIPLNSLTGGSGTLALEDDLVIVSYGSSNTTDLDMQCGAGFTELLDVVPGGTGRRANTGVFYKFMTATPDTIAPLVVGLWATAITVQVWRGIDKINPFDVAFTLTNVRGGNVVNFQPITPVTPGAIVITTAFMSAQQGDTGAFTSPGAPIENLQLTARVSNNIHSMRGMAGSFPPWVSGATAPAPIPAVPVASTSTTATSHIAVTMALRPA